MNKNTCVQFGVGVCNGTVPLHFALRTLGIVKNDEVIIPNFLIFASAPDITLAKKEFMWEPKVNLQDGLKETISYFKNLIKS